MASKKEPDGIFSLNFADILELVLLKRKSFAIIIIIVFSLKNKSTSVNKMNIFYLYKDIVHNFPKLTIFFLDFTRM